jgi:hypothetical protein
VDRATYDRTIAWLREAVNRSKLGHGERVRALGRLAKWEGFRRRPAEPRG